MNSLEFSEQTLPVDFDGSANLDQLNEVSIGTHLEYPDGSVPMVTKAGSGRMSPVRARTMKEYDQQLAELKKENFSLKLRIYFLEERMQQKFDGDGEQLFKTAAQQNIELKVEVASLKEELIEKQGLLKKASNALETISTQHELELKQTRESASQDVTADSKTQLEELTKQIHLYQLQLQSKDDEVHKARRQLEDSNAKLQELLSVNRQLDAAYKQSEERGRELESRLDSGGEQGLLASQGIPEAVVEKNKVIEQLRSQIKTKELIIEQMEAETKEVKQPLEEQIQGLQKEVAKKEQQLQYIKMESSGGGSETGSGPRPSGNFEPDILGDTKRHIRDLELEIERFTQELQDKDHMIGNLEDLIRNSDKNGKTLERKLGELEKINRQHEENALKRDKAIQGLSKALQQKDKECQSLGEKFDGRDDELAQLKEQVHTAHMNKYQEIEKLQQESSSKEERIADLEAANREKTLENERFQKLVSRREADVSRLNAQLEKADEVLRQREDTMQDLRDVLHGEKLKNQEKADSLDNQYKALLDDAQRQINNQEKMIQRLSKSLQDKDRQLHGYMGMLQEQEPIHESRQSIISNLRQQVHDKEKEIEDAVQDKYSVMGEKDNEMRQLKMALRERDHDIERANQMLLTTEETIDTLETEAKEKDETMKQLAAALKASQKSLEEVNERSNRSMQEKEAIVQKLRGSLAKKDQSLQEVIRLSPSASDATIQHLQQRLAEKENLMQEVMTERSRAADNHAQATQELLKNLKTKDEEIKAVRTQMKEEVSSLSRQLQGLHSELNKKDYDLQTLENRASWAEEQQQEMLDKLRAAVNEKELTIEALVESGREKDRLFLQLRGMSPDHQAAGITSQLAELQELKDQVLRLHNQLQNKEGLISRLRMAAERRSPKPDTVSRQRLDDAEQEIAQRTEALTRALLAEKEAKQRITELQKNLRKSEEESENVVRLKLELEYLRDQIERPGSPKRTQTIGSDGHTQLSQVVRDQLQETGALGDALRAERDLYIELNQTHSGTNRSEAFDIELAAIQSLRRQLEHGVESNNLLRSQLEQQLSSTVQQHTDTGEDADVIGELRRQVESLQNQLEESSRWTSSLEARLNQQQTQKRGGGVGGTDSDSFRASVERGLKESSPGYNNSFFPSFQNLPDVDQLIPGDSELAKMKPKQLQLLIKNIRAELNRSSVQNESLEQQLDTLKQSRISSNVEAADKEMNGVGHEPVVDMAIGGVEDKNEELHKLQAQLNHTENMNNLLKRQIELNTKTNGSASGFNPELIVQMAQEIERLKEELESDRLKSQSTESLGKKQGKRSYIPTLQRNGRPLKVPNCNIDSEKTDLNDLKMQKMMLHGKLASTEATVRCQAEKMKYYRGMLETAGLIPKSPKRSNSESNLSVMESKDRTPVTSRVSRRRSRSATAVEINSDLDRTSPTGGLSRSTSLQALNLSKFTNFGRSHNVKELQDQVCELKQQLASYDHVVRQLRSTQDKPRENQTPIDNVSSPDPLQTEVNSLKGQLAEAQIANKLLRTQLDKGKTPSMKYLQKMIEAHRCDNASLRNQLQESQGACGMLQQRLEELSDFLEELLHQNEQGEVDMIDITPQRVSSLKQKLNDTRSMLADLTLNLTAAGEDETEVSRLESSMCAGPQGPGAGEGREDDLTDRYDLAQFRIQELEVQLETMSKENETKSKNKEHVMSELEKEAQEIQQRNSELISKNTQLQKLHSEQVQKLKSVETDTGILKSKLEKLQAERGALKLKIDSLETECEQLQGELINQRQRTINSAGEQANLHTQLNEEKKAARKLKDMLCDSQSRADDLKATLERLTGEVDDKNATIQKLKEKLREVREKQKRESIPISRERGHHQGSLFDSESLPSHQSIERARHQTGSSTSSVPPFFDSPEHIVEDKSSIDGSKNSSRRDKSKWLSGDSTTDPSQDKVDFAKYISKSDKAAENSAADYSPGPQTDDLRRFLGPDLCKQIGAVSGDSLFPASSASEHHDTEFEEKYKSEISRLRGEIETLKSQLKEEMELNENMKGELNIYERLNCSASEGVENTPRVAPHSSPSVSGYNNEQLTLNEHLSEIRLLRQRLEETVRKNDHLREQLEKQLAKAKNGDIANIYVGMHTSGNLQNIQQELESLQRQVQQKDNRVANMQREIQRLQSDVDFKKEELHSKQIRVVELQSIVEKFENKAQLLDLEKGAIMVERDNAKKDAKRLRNEVTRLHDQLQENTELNKTLRLELSVLGQVTGETSQPDPSRPYVSRGGSLDLSLLMEEIRQLRLQLEKTIENNNMLRQRLEEYGRNAPSGVPADINIHHVYSNGEPERDGRDHARNSLDNMVYTDHMERFTRPVHRALNVFSHPSLSDPQPGSSLSDPQPRSLSQHSAHSLNSDSEPCQSPLSLTTDCTTLSTHGMPGISNYAASPPTKLDAPCTVSSGSHQDYTVHPEQIDRHYETRGGALRPEDLAVGSLGMASQRLSRGEQFSQPHQSNSAPGVSFHGTPTSPHYHGHGPLSSPGYHSPGSENMRYSIYDTNRPPSSKDKTPPPQLPDSTPPTTEGMVNSRVGADIRSLYAICALDDYELLKKEIAESNNILASVNAVLQERLKHYKHSSPSQSLEYSTLRALSVNVDNLRALVGEEQRLIALFWVNSLPQRDASGNFIDTKMAKENQALRIDLAKMSRTYSQVKKNLKAANEKLEAINKKKAQVGRSIIKQLTKTEEVIRKAGNNLEKAHQEQEKNTSQ